jgi:hypothetical protein
MHPDPANVMDGLLVEARRLLDEMERTQDLEIRRIQSETVRNLCTSLSVFFDAINSVWPDEDLLDFDMEEDDDEI